MRPLPQPTSPPAPRVVIVAEHASARFGGEAVLPLHYFRRLRARGVAAWLVVHARTRGELAQLLGQERSWVRYVPETPLERWLYRVGLSLPPAVRAFTTRALMRYQSQGTARRLVRRLVARHAATVVHQPIPVSPREPSRMHGVGAPVVIGPLNGGMRYPPGMGRAGRARGEDVVVRALRLATNLANLLIPGKRRAAAVLVANDRTARALPRGARRNVITLVENGVDLALWRPPDAPRSAGTAVRFAFVGRLVAWKAVDLLLHALAQVRLAHPSTRLEIVGGTEAEIRPLRGLTEALDITSAVTFHGWLAQPDCAALLRDIDALVLPSLYECGGAVVLEAMACGLPVVATNWGGPADYLDDSCGILVDPTSREAFIDGLANAMARLAADPKLRAMMGAGGREKVVRLYDWERKIDRILTVYGSTAASTRKHEITSTPSQTNSKRQ